MVIFKAESKPKVAGIFKIAHTTSTFLLMGASVIRHYGQSSHLIGEKTGAACRKGSVGSI